LHIPNRYFRHIPNHKFDIFIYAANGGYLDLMEATARAAAVEMSMGDILSRIPAELALPWVKDLDPIVWEHD
jgi:hypothetical protein